MSATSKKYRVGELRPSQILFTYGIGSILDLPFISTMVMGLEDWENPYPVQVGEERLLQAPAAVGEKAGALSQELLSRQCRDRPYVERVLPGQHRTAERGLAQRVAGALAVGDVQ